MVIAIIAILTGIVIVAMDPIRRINDSYDRTAASNVRSTGTLISVCVASKLAQNPPENLEDCAGTELDDFGTRPPGVLIVADSSAEDDVCAAQQGSTGLTGHYYVYKSTTWQGYGKYRPIPSTICLV